MIKESKVMLKNRPYFGGVEDKTQVRRLNEIKPFIDFIEFDICGGALRLIHVVTYPFTVCSDWCFYYEEIGRFNRRSHSKRLLLSKYSVIPHNDGTWENYRCLLKADIINLRNKKIDIKKYQPQYY